MFKKKAKGDLYLSDRPPLTTMGKILLALSYLILIFWAVVILWPIMQMVLSAFNVNQISYLTSGVPMKFGIRHFQHLFQETNYLIWMRNTLFISISSVIITLIFVSFTGYAYSRFRFKGRKQSLLAIMLIQTIPAFVGIAAYFAIFTVLKEFIPFVSRQLFLVLIYAGGGIAGNTFILKGYLDSVPMDLDESAKIDGCSNLQTYWLIIMPIVRPMLAIIALWSFIGPFVDFLLPQVILARSEDLTVAAGLFTLISDQRTINQPAFAAGGLLIMVPISLLFIFLQRQLISGLASGAVKG